MSDKPLGYYISLPKSNEHYARLGKIETQLGSFFQNLTLQQLKNALAYCSCIYAGEDKEPMTSAYLDAQTLDFQYFPNTVLFSFIPFLHSVIRGRLI